MMLRILSFFFALLMGLIVLIMASVTAQRTGSEMVWQAGLWLAGMVTGYLSAMLDGILRENA